MDVSRFKSWLVVFFALTMFQGVACAVNKKAKIVALMQVRNEEIFLAQTLLCLEPYVDAIVILDDASTDQTLQVIETLSTIVPIEAVIKNEKSAWLEGNESDNQQKLLEAGRKIGGTHFIVIDADEIFSANCQDNNYLRKQILALQPGQYMAVQIIQLWQSTNQYNKTRSQGRKTDIFCDTAGLAYRSSFLHGCSIPFGFVESPKHLDPGYVLLHFQFINWRFLLLKQAWYRCLELIRSKNKSHQEINGIYGYTVDESDCELKACPKKWFDKYPLFDPTIYETAHSWREQQVLEWFSTYGRDYFKCLDIWNINWGAGV